MSEGQCRYKVVGNQMLIFDDKDNLIGASGLPTKKAVWKDCTKCKKFNLNNFTCKVYGWGTLQDKKYLGCGDYAGN